MQILTRTTHLLQLVLLAALLATSFLVHTELFEGIITAKQRGVEVVVLFTVPLLIVALFFSKKLRFTLIDLLVLLFCAWSLFNEAVILNAPYRELSLHVFTLSLWLLIYLFVRSITDKSILLCGVVGLWMIFSLLHAGLGLMQLHGFATSHHGLFKITGAFHNPGPFSGFIVSGLPLALGIILFANSPTAIPPKKLFYRILNYLFQTIAWITLISVLLVLPPAQSRAAWMAGLVGVAFLLIRFPNKISVRDSLVSRFKNLKRSMRLLITISVLAVVAGSATGFYLFKQGSADGRLLIWRITTQMIKTKPITGYGAGAFNALYMDEQARWFASGKGSETQALVAGSPEAPFNEFLKLWLEKGLIGLLLVGALLFYLIKKQHPKENSLTAQDESINTHSLNQGLIVALQGALISLLVFSLFSYPFDISSFLLQLVVAVAVLSRFSKPVIELKGTRKLLATLPLSLIVLCSVIYFVPQRTAYYQALKTWQQADRLYNMGAYNSAVEAYEEAAPTLKSNGLFLQMYGKALNMDAQYEKSNEVLTLAQERFSSQIIQNTLGDNHKALGNFIDAETAYSKSTYMIPSLIYPKYLLAKLYTESGQHKKARQAAEAILNSNVKVESLATREIMNEMKNIVTQSEGYTEKIGVYTEHHRENK